MADSPVLDGVITCPPDGRAEIHWPQIKPGYWKSHDASSASDCHECLRPTARWGSPFLAMFLVFGAVYFGGGALYSAKVKGVRPGLDAHPHWHAWLELRSLVFDGFAFVRGGGRGGGRRGVGFEVVGDGGGRQQPAPPPAAPARRSKGPKAEKKEKTAKKINHKSSLLQPQQQQQVVVEVETARGHAATGTAASGGGRWVHTDA